MAFPTTPVLDDFNRAGPALGANWTSPAWNDAGTAAITGSTQLFANATSPTVSSAIYSGTGFGPDMEAYITVATAPDSTATSWGVGIFSNTSTTPNGYLARYTISGTTVIIRRIDSGSSSAIGATKTQTVASGDALGISRVGTTIYSWYKASGGSWTLLDSVTDATYIPSGWFCGVELGGGTNAGRWDDLGGGTVAWSRLSAFAAIPFQAQGRNL